MLETLLAAHCAGFGILFMAALTDPVRKFRWRDVPRLAVWEIDVVIFIVQDIRKRLSQ